MLREPMPQGREVLCAMRDSVAHRGPDSAGAWMDSSGRVGLGHRRLAIVDLTEEGHQPMASATGRYVVVFNGEIYNFRRLRDTLRAAGHAFHGQSDTEVMLAAFEEWGIDGALQRLLGMFAFAVWDSATRRLTLGRDRVGKKPLYYSQTGKGLLFGSELKSLIAFPGYGGEVDTTALSLYLRHGYVPGALSILSGTRKLEPGCSLAVSLDSSGRIITAMDRYWDPVREQRRVARSSQSRTMIDAVQELDATLRDSVSLRMIADVPLGAFLSGGIDSSTVVALMQAQSTQPVRTFTIGFREQEFDEAPHASAVARHLGTCHTELFVTPMEAMQIIPKLPDIYDEPFGDSSQIPTSILCALARGHVTVAVSGDGGDEAFVGYGRYAAAEREWGLISRVPRMLRQSGAGVGRIGARALSAEWFPWALVGPRGEDRVRSFLARIERRSEMIGSRTPMEFYGRRISYWLHPERLLRSPPQRAAGVSSLQPLESPGEDYSSDMALHDFRTYLPDDVLVKVDRASMAVALEVRAPILDHRVLEFAWSLPANLKSNGREGKLVLKELLARYVPRALFERPKAGFGVPVGAWLRGPMRDWAESLLHPQRLRDEGYLHPTAVRNIWRQHLSGCGRWSDQLWIILMFQAWLERWKRSASGTPRLS